MRGVGAVCRIGTALLLAAILSAALAGSAVAGPQLGLELQRTEEPLHVGDGRMVYEVTVGNDASTTPKVGDELACKTSLSGNPAPTASYAWLRNGEEIVGAESNTYTTTVQDEGKAIQCKVTVTHDPGDVLPSPTYAPISLVRFSPPIVIAPLPTSMPPIGSSEPKINGLRRPAPDSVEPYRRRPRAAPPPL